MDRQILTRIITVIILLPIALFSVLTSLWNGFPLMILILLIGVIIVNEIAMLAEKRGMRIHPWVTSPATTLSIVSYYFYGKGIIGLDLFFIIETGVVILLFFFIFILESWGENFDKTFENIAFAGFAFIVTGFFLPFIILIKLIDLSGWLLVVSLVIPWLSDTGGLFAGMLFGKHKLPKLASPNKTLEGYIGTVVLGLLTAIICFFIQRWLPIRATLTFSQFMILAIGLISTAIFGDLGESAIKRWADVKDAGSILPGHGGFFDRMDSIILSAPLFYILIRLMGFW